MVEIIPKSFEEIPAWQRILLYFLIFLLIAIIIIYFLLGNFQKESEAYFKNLEKRLSEEKAPQIAELREENLDYKKRIEDFSLLFENHVLNKQFFEFIEAKSHPKVFFSEVNLNSQNLQASLFGLTDSFLSLGQQVLIFREDELVKDLILSNVSIGKTGGVEFDLELFFKEELFNHLTTPINKE
jgi:hypothetical protein